MKERRTDNLVFLEPNKLTAKPFTTSEVIAEYAQVKHHAIQQMISKHEKALKAFGVIAFEMRKPPEGSKGGRPETIYHLTEEQSTLLITFLKNTEPVIKFKTELVRQFFEMRKELLTRQMLRTQLKPIRRELTDVIRDDPNKKKWDYKLYTDLAYKAALGMTAKQVRDSRGAKPHDAAIGYMTAEEIAKVEKSTSQISVLKEMGMDYQQIKALMLNRLMVGQLTA